MGEFSMQDAIKQFLKQSRIKGGIQALQIEEDSFDRSYILYNIGLILSPDAERVDALYLM